ncbi:hypothetical protein FU658_03460 [Alkalisalibacterium limincola]|uniref:EF-hand domain-containing protein n=1 Tax=Alkalisalibacterium limincola TaxID=2699169 RepID=A0A5C8KZV8_9GAMM|nr:hypothetical protein FU658_03460 [Alkalisalibacterium limincola]
MPAPPPSPRNRAASVAGTRASRWTWPRWRTASPGCLAIDANGDGIITAEEMIAHRDAQRLQREQRRLQRYDRSGDGVVTVEDYVAAHSDRLARMDADGDGVITREEMRESRKGMRGGRGMHRGGHGGR